MVPQEEGKKIMGVSTSPNGSKLPMIVEIIKRSENQISQVSEINQELELLISTIGTKVGRIMQYTLPNNQAKEKAETSETPNNFVGTMYLCMDMMSEEMDKLRNHIEILRSIDYALEELT